MNQNEQDNKPERTAELIELLSPEVNKLLCDHKYGSDKEYVIGLIADSLADSFEDSPGHQYYDMAKTLYNQKYPNHGK